MYFNSQGKMAVCGLCRQPLKHQNQKRCGFCYAVLLEGKQ